MKTIKDLLLIGLSITVMVFILFKGCSDPFPNLEVVPQQMIIVTHDTVFSKDTLIKFKSIIKPVHDTIYQIDEQSSSNIDCNDLFFNRVYNDSLSDSNQTIYSSIAVKGYLDNITLSYRNKVKPIFITKTIINTVTNIEYKPSKVMIYTGLQIGGNKTSFEMSPIISFGMNRSMFQYSYGILNQTHSVGCSFRIFNSKK